MQNMSDRLTLTQVAKELDVAVSTTWRWVIKGVKGKKLRSRLVGGRRYVYRRDLSAFLAAEDDVNVMTHEDAERSLRSQDM